MSQNELRSSPSQPFAKHGAELWFVRLGTMQDMGDFAKKMAMIREAVREIVRIEGELQKGMSRADRKWANQGIREIADAASKAKMWSQEAITILQTVKGKVEGYLKEIPEQMSTAERRDGNTGVDAGIETKGSGEGHKKVDQSKQRREQIADEEQSDGEEISEGESPEEVAEWIAEFNRQANALRITCPACGNQTWIDDVRKYTTITCPSCHETYPTPSFGDRPDLSLSLQLAQKGYAFAQYSMGKTCFSGEGVAKDSSAAAKWFRKAAHQGYADAQFRLGNLLSSGDGVPKNSDEAVEWFYKAAKQGHTTAQLLLRTIADTGHADAQYKLASCCLGLKELQTACRWLLLAAAAGKQEAIDKLTSVEKQLTKAEMQEARKWAKEWKPTREELPNASGKPDDDVVSPTSGSPVSGDDEVATLSEAEPASPAEADIHFACPKCGKHMVIERAGAGFSVACPSCGERVQVPTPE